MNLLGDAIGWIFSGDPGRGFDAIPVAIGVQLLYTVVAVLIAGAIAVPLGWYIGHTGKGRETAVAISGAARAIPSFGLLILLTLLLGVLHKPEAAIISFVVLAIPSLLAGAYTGFEAIDRRVIDAGRSMGMTESQILWRIEVPLGLPLLVGGIRAATLQVLATVTIAAYIGLGGLGQYIIAAIPLRRFDILIGGAILVAVLALVIDGLFALLQHLVVPRGIRAAGSAQPQPRSARQRRAEALAVGAPTAPPATP
ncbi:MULTISPECIES: ABC transporter permease [Microbacterium]|jgi:osmoprotectant transport system permease protein|uniref:Osmoprotectant transport system permease protein n=1 Tax=Microbacterium testaceum (strain StLB037) TaxID=979556 RepID=A0A1H0RV76_MICTS|nr:MULTISPECIES: ABC transporter permease [Microbacterium]KQM38331.1 glycine/betaine ABC transporter permease [Microbacterium sp. Leaf203]SDP33315.1 osmoprotectant transport system permease protein [Microbacterium testaceum StLB037]